MDNPTNNDLTNAQVIDDFKQFKSRLEQLKDNLDEKYKIILAELQTVDFENVKLDQGKIDEYYRIYAEFTEDANLVKMLYQVLLQEYVSLEIFDENDYLELKNIACHKIEILLRAGKWIGMKNSESRAAFRFEMLKLIRQRVHKKSIERKKDGNRIAAICFSGGGIRSATFGLGVLQGLAKHNLLSRFDYISSVSGGGYISSWLSAWIHRINKQDKEFTNENAKKVEKKLVEQTAELTEPAEITHLRSYSNFMSPRPGMFSADTWTLIAVYLRNLLLNWTVFVPLIAAILLIPKMLVTFTGLDFGDHYQTALLIVALIAGIGAIVNINAMRPSLKKISWVDQKYKTDNIGIIKSVEAKIFRWVLLWIIVLAFSGATFWYLTKGNSHFAVSYWIADFFKTTNFLLIDCIVFSEILFLGGYLLAWLIILVFYLTAASKNTNEVNRFNVGIKHFYHTYFREFAVSTICGFFSGALLYLLVKNLSHLSVRFYSIINKISNENIQNALTPEFFVCFGAPLFLLAFLLSATLFVGFAVRFTDDEDREWMARFGAWVLMFIIGWSVISTAVIFGPKIFGYDWKGSLFASVGGISGLITLILGFSNKSSAKNDEQPKTKKSFLLWFAPAIAAPIFVLFLVVLISFVTNALTENVNFYNKFTHLMWFVILTIIGFLMGYFININKFSFHSIYRERLIRAYLGASRTKDRLYTANSFTGLDSEEDNLEMRDLKHKPFHVVNMTLNLVKTDNLRWQNRKAESFTATSLFCGSSNMGEGSGNYRSSEDYGFNLQNGRPLTLGTTAAISGAAASPNMGYYTMSAAVSFLMVLFNVRLGWWLGNPGSRGERTFGKDSSFLQKNYVRLLTFLELNKTYNQPAPRWSPRLFLDESIGGTNDSKPYVYLSDGGHFDNLGLYEMVLRRCQLIVVSDAGCDDDFAFSDFGTSIHKIRVDMGIPIEFEKDKHPMKTRNCGIGKIKYSCVDGEDATDGILIYIKPTLDGDEPIDLKNYKKENPDFPHESTADQMYSETQFESYRSLGYHQINSICCQKDECNCQNLSHLESNAKRYLRMFQNKEKRRKRRVL